MFNSGKTRIPVDIWVDDLGTGDPATSPDVDEGWPGFLNAAKPDPVDSASGKWGALPGDTIALENQATTIGSPPNRHRTYIWKGVIDWILWKPEVDYTGVGEDPHY